MRRLAIITPFAPPQRSAAVTRFTSLEAYLIKRGWSVDLWAPAWLRLCDGPVPANVRYFTGRKQLLAGLARRLPDTVLVTTPPGDLAFDGALCARLLLRPVLFDIRDPWTLAQVALGSVDARSNQYRRQMRVEHWTFRLASRYTVVSPFLQRMLCNHFRLNIAKFAVVPNGVELGDFRRDDAARKEIREGLGIPDESPTIVYEGIVGGKELDQFLRKCGRQIANAGGHILFVVIADVWSQSLVDELSTIANDAGIGSHFHLVGDVGHTDMYRYLSAADIAVNPLPSNLAYCLPIKAFEYMACELPVMSKASPVGPLADIHREHGIGPFASDWQEFCQNLTHVLGGRVDFKAMGRANRKTAEAFFSREKANEVFLKELETLVS
jgi:glycosyltransferase involved in cell wall biosynthesis